MVLIIGRIGNQCLSLNTLPFHEAWAAGYAILMYTCCLGTWFTNYRCVGQLKKRLGSSYVCQTLSPPILQGITSISLPVGCLWERQVI